MACTPDPADVVPGPLSSRALKLIAESIGACSREWQSRVRMDEGVRWRTRLHSVTGNGAPGTPRCRGCRVRREYIRRVLMRTTIKPNVALAMAEA